MDIQQAQQLLEQLRSREVKQVHISKEDFLAFRLELLKCSDFKHYRGNAQRGGGVIYTYLDVPRS